MRLKLIGAGIALLAVISLTWWIRGNIADNDLQQALQSQETELVAACQKNVSITEENSRDYQTQLTAARNRVMQLQRSNTCVSVASKTNSGTGGTKPDKHVGTDGVPASSLFELAGECEQYRLQVISLQKFINDERK